MARSLASSLRARSLAVKLTLALAIATSAALTVPAPAYAGVDIAFSVNIAPPVLPVYEQPAIPGYGYIWTPGYWAWDAGDGYYWVPGTWVRPPYHGALWTPGYWGWHNNAYVFFRGYWGRRVGYYGGIDYGHGYGGVGYEGGYWRGRNFFYNRTVNNITNVRITNVYNKTIVRNVTINRYSFNGPGGATARASAADLAYARQKHTAPVASQLQQRDWARGEKSLRASENKGKPPVLARPEGRMFNKPVVSRMDGTPGGGAGKGAAQGQRLRQGNGPAGHNGMASGTADTSAARQQGPSSSQVRKMRNHQRPVANGEASQQPLRQAPDRGMRRAPRNDHGQGMQRQQQQAPRQQFHPGMRQPQQQQVQRHNERQQQPARGGQEGHEKHDKKHPPGN